MRESGPIKELNDTLRKWDVCSQYNTEIQQAMSSVEKSTRDEVLDYCSIVLKDIR